MIVICDELLGCEVLFEYGFHQQDPVRKVSLLEGRRGLLIATFTSGFVS